PRWRSTSSRPLSSTCSTMVAVPYTPCICRPNRRAVMSSVTVTSSVASSPTSGRPTASAVGARVVNRSPHPLGGQRQVEVADPEVGERVDHRVLHGRSGADGGGLADPLGPQRVQGCRGLGV